MTRDEGSSPRVGGEEPSHPVLRAKYLDYCSARVADLLLKLTPDEMYILGQEAAQELESGGDAPLSYTEIVRLATDRIASKLSLPDFQSWAGEYRRDPARFERELLGLWEMELPSSGRDAPEG